MCIRDSHLPSKLAVQGQFEFYRKRRLGSMARTWNGDRWGRPIQPRCVVLVTAVFLFHRFHRATEWKDIRYLILDELHRRLPLALLFVQFFVHLLSIRDPRVEHVKLLLMTATRAGPAIAAVGESLCRTGNEDRDSSGSICSGTQGFRRAAIVALSLIHI